MSESAANPLDMYCENLTLLARCGRFSWRPAHAVETARAFDILACRYEPSCRHPQKSNPVFVGADRAERRQALESATAALVREDAPAALRGRTILSLDFDALMAGVDAQALVKEDQAIRARYPSAYPFNDLEHDAGLRATLRRYMRERKEWARGNVACQRLRAVLGALQGATSAILFIDHLHRFLGGDWRHYPFDMAPELKPLLYRRKIQLWGACALTEYQMIERDPAMQRCFQQVYLPGALLPRMTG